MPTGSEVQQALQSFMARPTGPQPTRSPREAIDKLSKSSTGHETGPFVPQCVGPFWEPSVQEALVPVSHEDVPVVPPNLTQLVQSSVSSLLKKTVSTNTFVAGLTQLGFPDSVILSLLTKLGLIFEKNGKQMVQRINMTAFVKALVLMKERVDFFLAVIERLRCGSIVWKNVLNPNNSQFIDTALSKDDLKRLFLLFRSLGFNSGLDDELSLPASWSSLSMADCSNQVWTAVSQWDWDLPLPAKKRGREDESHHRNGDKQRVFSPEELISTVLSKLTRSLLATHGLGELSLCDFFWTAFLDMSPEHLRQMMEFLSNEDNKWRLQRILMEVPQLNVRIHNKDVCLSMGDKFTFLSFNLDEMLKHFNGLFLEAIMMRQMAGQELHEQELQRERERQRVNGFITAICNLWKTKDMSSFFKELVAVSPEFNSFSTNWRLLEVVVDEFINRIYNSTTRAYHNREPCANPLQEFLEYAITRGVFTELPEEGAFVRVCDSSLKDCLFGNRCSGVHQDFVNKHWRPNGGCFGQCCSEYMNRGTCRNSYCRYAHANVWEILRAYIHGSTNSKKERELLKN
jgi:hypothetical protein